MNPNIFTCVASQHLILCNITATTTTTAAARFLNFYLEQTRRQDSRGCSTGKLSVNLETIFECVQFVHNTVQYHNRMTENWNGPELSLLTKLTLMGVNNPIRAKECDTTHNSSELLGKAKNKRLIRIPNIRAELIVCTSLDDHNSLDIDWIKKRQKRRWH